MKWTKNCSKPDGTLRKQFAYWQIPANVRNRTGVKDGDRVQISISVGFFRHIGTYKLTSGGEIRLKADLAGQIAEIARDSPSSAVAFELGAEVGLTEVEAQFKEEVAESLGLSADARRKKLASFPEVPERRELVVVEFVRNPHVVAEVLLQAKGICQACKKPAPFLRASDGTPYLEVHHIRRLADGGHDTVENARALCPNCHRKAHFG